MFLIKDEEIRYYVNQGPNKTYEKFAQSVHSLCGNKVTIQEIWSIFLSLHGFVSHYIGHVSSFEEVEGLAEAHADFLIRVVRKRLTNIFFLSGLVRRYILHYY